MPTMRISQNTASRLALRDRTLWISVICFSAAVFFIIRAAVVRDQPSVLIPGALFVIFGLAFLRATDVTFDRSERTCAMRRLDVLRLTRMRLAFEDILDARVEIAPFPESASALSCRLSLVTTSAVVPLTAGYEPSYARYNEMRDAVLDAVFEHAARPAAVDPVRMLVEEGRINDAVAILRMREGLDLTTASARVNALRNAPDA
jgi:signal transduction histidine kinase